MATSTRMMTPMTMIKAATTTGRGGSLNTLGIAIRINNRDIISSTLGLSSSRKGSSRLILVGCMSREIPITGRNLYLNSRIHMTNIKKKKKADTKPEQLHKNPTTFPN